MSRLFALACLVVSVWIVGDTMFNSGAWQRRASARSDLQALRHENADAEERVRSLRTRVDAMRNRADVRERVVRNELGYVRQGEVVIELKAQ